MRYSRINLLLGPPGAGKTFAAETFARQRQATLVFHQCHAWTDADELFVGVDVQAAVAGEADAVRQDGVLARAARLTAAGEEVVLVLDELDKAPERAEALLLDFLQSGRVPIRPGVHLQANFNNLWVFITSNLVRPHSGALMRRCKRFFLEQMRPEEVAAILADQGYDHNMALVLARLGAWCAALEGNEDGISLQEVRHLLDDLEGVASFQEFRDQVVSWFCRTPEGARRVAAHGKLAKVWGVLASW